MCQIGKNTKIAKTAIIHKNVLIEDEVIIHDYVVIYPGTVVKRGTEIFDHCVLGKLPTSPGITSRVLKTEYDYLVVGEYCVLCPGVVLYAGTTIGHNNLLGDFCSIREDCKIGNNCIISRNVSVNYNTEIGNYTKIMDNTHITGNMKIGNHVFISVLVATTNDNTMGREEYNSEHVFGATIEDDVTIGAAANILPHVTIGKNAIVGAGAVVTKNIPPNKVVMGIPAKIIKNVEQTSNERKMDRCCKVICNLDGDVGRKLSNTSAYLMQIQGVGNTVWELGEIENEEADRESMACNQADKTSCIDNEVNKSFASVTLLLLWSQWEFLRDSGILEICIIRNIPNVEPQEPERKVLIQKVSPSMKLLCKATTFNNRYLELEADDGLKSRMWESCTYGSVRGSRLAFYVEFYERSFETVFSTVN